MSNEIELYSRLQNPIEAINALGDIFAKSGMFGCDKPEQGKVLAMICMVERKSPVAITTNYDIVEGKLRKKSLAALADFRIAGGKHKWLKSGDEATAKDDDRFAELQLTDREGNVITYRYSMADAKAEGLIRPNSRWTKRPGNMLRARCISNGLGMVCPEIFAGDDEEQSIEIAATPLLPERPKRERPATVAADPVNTAPIESKPVAAAPVESKAQPAFNIADSAIEPATGRLNLATMAALENAIGEANMPAVILWLKHRQWISDTLSELSVERTKRILSKTPEFLAQVSKK